MGWNIVYAGPSAALQVHSSGRYLTYHGSPLLICGDSAWSMAVQLTPAQIDTYMADRAAKGFNAVLVSAIEHYFSSQSPAYQNVSGNNPFSSMTDFGSAKTEAYWSRVDYIVNAALASGIIVFLFPAYWGYGGGSEGWWTEINAESDADLQAYGAWLANRYTQANIVWCMGGDWSGSSSADRDKQWHIVTGMRTVRTTDIITAHPAPQSEAYASWSGYAGINLNLTYPSYIDEATVYSYCATAYGRAGPVPFIMAEAMYENQHTATDALLRRQAWTAVLSGACGHFYGNKPTWSFGDPNGGGGVGAAQSLIDGLNTTAAQQMAHIPALMLAYAWWLLEPKTGAEVISSSLGSGTTRICPALSSDGTFGLIWVPTSQTVTLVKSAFSPSNIRVRLYDPTAGTYSTHTASTANSGTLSVATGGERVIVVDAA